jgi:GNAT superfamily N-acetyltransferase
MLAVFIKRSTPDEHEALTCVAFAAKRYWSYPEEYFFTWAEELTFRPQYITENIVYSCYVADTLVGVYSLVGAGEEIRLDHLFIAPPFIGRGIGTKMLRHALTQAKAIGAVKIKIFADPFAAGFYAKAGAQQIAIIPSNIEGRNIPVFQLAVET